MYKVADLMTQELVTLAESDELGLAEAMVDLIRVRHLPVVRDGKLVGLVTQRDLLRALAEGRGRRVIASEIMRREVRTVSPGASLQEAGRQMLQYKIGCLPVTLADGRLVGILTESDLVRFALEVIQELDDAASELASQSVPPP